MVFSQFQQSKISSMTRNPIRSVNSSNSGAGGLWAVRCIASHFAQYFQLTLGCSNVECCSNAKIMMKIYTFYKDVFSINENTFFGDLVIERIPKGIVFIDNRSFCNNAVEATYMLGFLCWRWSPQKRIFQLDAMMCFYPFSWFDRYFRRYKGSNGFISPASICIQKENMRNYVNIGILF